MDTCEVCGKQQPSCWPVDVKVLDTIGGAGWNTMSSEMKVSDVVAALRELQKQHGDLPVYLDDPDTGWALTPEIATGVHPEDGLVATVTGNYDQPGRRDYLEGRP